MKAYELTVLIHPDLETDIEAPLTVVRELVAKTGGSVTSEDNWGKKKLAYAINRENFAVYVYMELELPAEAPLTISNALNINDQVLRYLLVKFDEKGRALLEDAKQRAKARGITDDTQPNER